MYYSGHGFEINDGKGYRNYLLATSADLTSSARALRKQGIPLDEIIDQLSLTKATLIFVDACRTDPRNKRADSGRGFTSIDRTNHGGVFVGLSTRPGTIADDGEPGKGSPFARAFARHIVEPATRGDDAFTAIRQDVEKETERRQRPDVGLYELDAPVVLQADVPTSPASSAHTAPLINPSALLKRQAVPGRQEDAPFGTLHEVAPPAATDTLTWVPIGQIDSADKALITFEKAEKPDRTFVASARLREDTPIGQADTVFVHHRTSMACCGGTGLCWLQALVRMADGSFVSTLDILVEESVRVQIGPDSHDGMRDLKFGSSVKPPRSAE